MHSSIRPPQPDRSSDSGVALLETLIAFVLLAAFSMLVLRVISSGLGSAADREAAYWRAEFLRSKAEEFDVLPDWDQAAARNEPWQWTASAKPFVPEGGSPFKADIALFELTLTGWQAERPDQVTTLQTILARRP